MIKNQTVMREPLLFSLTKTAPHCPQHTVTVDFTPPPGAVPSSSSGPAHSPILPAFNPDQLFFTPAFHLPKDAVTLSSPRSSTRKTGASSC